MDCSGNYDFEGDYVKILKENEEASTLTFCGIKVFGVPIYDETLSYTQAGWILPREDEVDPLLTSIPVMSTEPCAGDLEYAKVMMAIEY